jgi:hypothetical protein
MLGFNDPHVRRTGAVPPLPGLLLARGNRHVPRSRPLGLAALAILAVATAPLTLIAGIPVSTAVLLAVAIADTVSESDRAPSASVDISAPWQSSE